MPALDPEEDAYGQLIWDYHERGEGREVVEREDGYIDVGGGPAVYFESFPDWPRHQQEAMEHVQGRVLDVGCGAGRVSLHLQEQGHEVVAIDNSPRAVAVCRDRGVEDARVLPITRVSSRLGTFDTIVMMGNNFGLVANPRRAGWLLRRFRAMTSTDGRIVAETRDVYQTDNEDHLAYQRWNRERGRMPGQIRLRVRHRTFATPWFDYLMVSKEELEAILQNTGWTARTYLDATRWEGVYVAVLEKTG